MSKKYEITDIVKYVAGRELHQIRALVDGRFMRKGDLGGYIESWKNLSQGGNAWVGNESCVCDNARVCQDGLVANGSMVFEDALVCGNAFVNSGSIVRGRAKIMDNASVIYHSVVDGLTFMKEFSAVISYSMVRNVFMSAEAKVSESAVVDCDETTALIGAMHIAGNVRISSARDILYVHAGNGAFTFYRNNDGVIVFSTNYDIPCDTLDKLVPFKDGPDAIFIENLIELARQRFK